MLIKWEKRKLVDSKVEKAEGLPDNKNSDTVSEEYRYDRKIKVIIKW